MTIRGEAVRSLSGQVVLVYALLLLIFLGGSVWYLTFASERFALNSLTEQLGGQAGAIATAALPYLTGTADQGALDRLAKEAAATTGARVTIIDTAGKVLGDSHHDPRSMDNHAGRPEVRQALTAGQGSSSRWSATLEERMLYVAVPVGQSASPLGVVRVAWPLSRVDSWLGILSRNAVLVTLVALAVGTAAFSLAARQLAAPFRQIREMAAAMARGSLDRRLYLRRPSEVAEVADGLNEVAARLQDTISQLEDRGKELTALLDHMADGVMVTDLQGRVKRVNPAARRMLGPRAGVPGARLTEITPQPEVRQALDRCLAGQEQEVLLQGGNQLLRLVATPVDQGAVIVVQDLTTIRRLETIRRDFVANLSHEIRTPLAVIKALAETLERTDSPEEARPFLSQLSGQVDRLTYLTRRLLELSRLESGQAELNFQPCAFTDVARLALRALGPVAGAKGVTLVDNLPTELPAVHADPDLIRELVSNLLDNAVKFTPAGGQVEVEAHPDGAVLQVQVKDTGHGISAEDLPRIFERFYKGERSRAGGGTGLGLAIAKHIVLAHGGNIWAESLPGHGSTFHFTLPLAGKPGAPLGG
ncbi:MAG TPA: cell wall metabolism sensor histidine kinase WalK [Firmicutes bacterium]|nr:cell wall metabolism sensor histidine kinase WalK [Bacillota bacterium]